MFRCEGDYWTIVFELKTVRLRDSKGMRCLASLLRRPGEQLSSVELHLKANPETLGKPKLIPSPEQARLTVTKAIKTALGRIATAHPELGAHLAVTVRRGYLCRYLPDPRRPIVWEK